MGFLIFLGSFCAAALGIWLVWQYVRNKVRRFSQQVFGTADILRGLESVDTIAEQSPRSLNGCDTLLMPQILKDFPDFDANLAKTYVRDYLKEKIGSKDAFTIHNVVIARYLPSAAQKTIVFQAATSHEEDGQKRQMRWDIHYTYLLGEGSSTVAANCPNCGGALGYGIRECPYCGSRVVNVMGNTWQFTEIIEN